VDEAHHEFHTASGRYRPFAGLLRSDGAEVVPGRTSFTRKALHGVDVLVIANALGDPRMDHPDAARSAFTPEECHVVADWVRAGGGLLLIADHAPMGAAASRLAGALDPDH
jgi:hypothetical protein